MWSTHLQLQVPLIKNERFGSKKYSTQPVFIFSKTQVCLLSDKSNVFLKNSNNIEKH